MEVGFNSNVNTQLTLDNKLMVDEKINGSNDQPYGSYKLALDIIVGVGFVLAGALAVAAYIQLSPVLLIPAAVAAITSVTLLILRCVIELDETRKPNDIAEKYSVIETTLVEEPLVEVLTVNWSESEDVLVNHSSLDKLSDPNVIYSRLGLPDFVMPNSSDILNPPIMTSNTSELETTLQDEKQLIIPEFKEGSDVDSGIVAGDSDLPARDLQPTLIIIPDCKEEGDVNSNAALGGNDLPPSDLPPMLTTDLLPILNIPRPLPTPQPRTTVQPTVIVDSDFDFPPSYLPPSLPENLEVIASSALVISPALLEQVTSEKAFGKSMRCAVKILAKIIEDEKAKLNVVDPLMLKMFDCYKVIAELSPKIGTGLKDANGNLSEIEKVIKTPEFDIYRQNLKEIILEFDLFDQMVKEIIKKSCDLQVGLAPLDGIAPLNETLGKIMQSYGFNIDGPPTDILQSAIKRMSQHEMILKEELKLLKKNEFENEKEFKLVESLIENFKKDNEDTNIKQSAMLEAREKFDELNEKISKLQKKDSRKLDSNLEVVKEDHLGTKHLKSMSRSLIGKKKKSNDLEPAERLKKLLDEITKLSESIGIKKEKVQAMCVNLAKSEWAKKILKHEKSSDLENCLMAACGDEK